VLYRFTRYWIALGLALGVWGLNVSRRADPGRTWLAPRGPVKILQFYASVGSLTVGQKALLCYGVENAKSIQISPSVQGVYPALSHCVEIGPEHTTHYTILAEGYDGIVATKSFTLAVLAIPEGKPRVLNFAELYH
jgi:hypothetical protein